MKAGADTVAFAATALLVCKDCSKRSSGPKHTKAKELARELRSLVRAQQPRPRVLLTSCLGLCPRRATAVARIEAGAADRAGASAVAAADGVASLQQVLPRLEEPAARSPLA